MRRRRRSGFRGGRRLPSRPAVALAGFGVFSLLAGSFLGSLGSSGWSKEGEVAAVPDVLYLEQEAAKVATIARVNQSIAREVDVDRVADASGGGGGDKTRASRTT